MRVIDDFLDPAACACLREALLAPGFPWEASQILSTRAAAHLAPDENRQLVHGFLLHTPGMRVRSPHLDLLAPLQARLSALLGPIGLVKAKANRTASRSRHIEYGLHVDTVRRGATTAIYYLNTNNGYTRFEDGSSIASVANRIVLFDSAMRHTGAASTDGIERLVLNLNLVPATPRRDSMAV